MNHLEVPRPDTTTGASNVAWRSKSLDNKGLLAFGADSSRVCIGPGSEVSKSGRPEKRPAGTGESAIEAYARVSEVHKQRRSPTFRFPAIHQRYHDYHRGLHLRLYVRLDRLSQNQACWPMAWNRRTTSPRGGDSTHSNVMEKQNGTCTLDHWRSGQCSSPPTVIDIPFSQLGEFVYHCHIFEHEDWGMMAKSRAGAQLM